MSTTRHLYPELSAFSSAHKVNSFRTKRSTPRLRWKDLNLREEKSRKTHSRFKIARPQLPQGLLILRKCRYRVAFAELRNQLLRRFKLGVQCRGLIFEHIPRDQSTTVEIVREISDFLLQGRVASHGFLRPFGTLLPERRSKALRTHQ